MYTPHISPPKTILHNQQPWWPANHGGPERRRKKKKKTKISSNTKKNRNALYEGKEYFYDATLRSLLRFVNTKQPSAILPTMADQHLIQASESSNVSQTS